MCSLFGLLFERDFNWLTFFESNFYTYNLKISKPFASIWRTLRREIPKFWNSDYCNSNTVCAQWPEKQVWFAPTLCKSQQIRLFDLPDLCISILFTDLNAAKMPDPVRQPSCQELLVKNFLSRSLSTAIAFVCAHYIWHTAVRGLSFRIADVGNFCTESVQNPTSRTAGLLSSFLLFSIRFNRTVGERLQI